MYILNRLRAERFRAVGVFRFIRDHLRIGGEAIESQRRCRDQRQRVPHIDFSGFFDVKQCIDRMAVGIDPNRQPGDGTQRAAGAGEAAETQGDLPDDGDGDADFFAVAIGLRKGVTSGSLPISRFPLLFFRATERANAAFVFFAPFLRLGDI